MITCRELIDFLADYADDTLPAAERAVFEEHLSVCPDCQNYVASYQRTIALEKVALARPDDEVPPEVPEELVRAILAARRGK
jgi:anti-sigma factor RsiW